MSEIGKNIYLSTYFQNYHPYLARDNDKDNPQKIHVGLQHLEKLFERLGTEEDTVTMAPKLGVLKHLYVKNQAQ